MIRKRYPNLLVEIRVIKTKGDLMQDVSLIKIGGKGVFVKEIEEALLAHEIDVAVHSMKDVPVEIPHGLTFKVIPKREDPRDVLVSSDKVKLETLPKGARIGTGSLRRAVQLKSLLRDIEIVPIRGNLDTRIRKISEQNLTGIIVAAAGMKRMGLETKISQYLPVETVLPAACQGVLGLETRSTDTHIEELLSFLHDEKTAWEVTAERAFLKRLGGGCQLPIAVYGETRGTNLLLRGMVGEEKGRLVIRDELLGPIENAVTLGTTLAERILAKGGEALLTMERNE